ncbi:MAG: 16S rRNA (guanine(527)-N(7))-methyltransferase RsmG [Bacteroidota bacterium]|nr:16S rRNA (guanine(527)-N(7))-methyltransferase RsmG [Bacteroidota bacterium]
MEILQKYFPYLSPLQLQQFSELGSLYNYWNERVNLISRKDIGNLYEHHVLHSLAIGAFYSFKLGQKVMDVGTGGGFPGIPLAILFPDTHFYLIDSIAKKIRVVNEISHSLNLENINAEQIRAEDVKTHFNYIVSRAVTSLPVFYKWVKDKFYSSGIHEPGQGIICLKGGDMKSELNELPVEAKEVPISDYFTEAFFETKKIIFIPVR